MDAQAVSNYIAYKESELENQPAIMYFDEVDATHCANYGGVYDSAAGSCALDQAGVRAMVADVRQESLKEGELVTLNVLSAQACGDLDGYYDYDVGTCTVSSNQIDSVVSYVQDNLDPNAPLSGVVVVADANVTKCMTFNGTYDFDTNTCTISSVALKHYVENYASTSPAPARSVNAAPLVTNAQTHNVYFRNTYLAKIRECDTIACVRSTMLEAWRLLD